MTLTLLGCWQAIQLAQTQRRIDTDIKLRCLLVGSFTAAETSYVLFVQSLQGDEKLCKWRHYWLSAGDSEYLMYNMYNIVNKSTYTI